jgi:sigma-B regulation protein RsbU (phosphoserine phosphatase)
VATTAAIALVTLREVDSTVNGLEIQSARNAVNLVLLTLENDYRSLTFHRSFALEERKRQMSDGVRLIMTAVAEHHDLAHRGLLSDQNARRSILDSVQGIRYGANDYFFIYDDALTAISHPDPTFRGRNLAQIPDARGNYPGRDLMNQARQGGGFVPFWWKRLDHSTPVAKLGYARYFEPWGWMVGTGVYIDDIEAEYNKRLEGVIADLAATLSKVKIAGGGYLFIFDGSRRAIIHPERGRDRFASARNPATGNLLTDDLMAAARSGSPLDYYWERPDRPSQNRFEKTALAAYFAPLDWYVVASIYRDDLRRPARNLLVKQFLIISLLSTLGVIGAAVIVNRFVSPVERLATYARELPARDFTLSAQESPDLTTLAERSDELGRLAASFRFMEHSLHDYLARLTATTAAKERIESELGIAHDIQMGLLHHTFPPFPERNEFDLLAVIKPAREVGGDFYDFFLTDDNKLFFVIADVAGKGVPAALYMAMTMALIKAIARTNVSPDEVLTRLNAELSHDNDTCMFVTVFCGMMDINNGELLFANGGHNPPLLINREGRAVFLKSVGTLPPGAMSGTCYRQERMLLERGDRLFLYTDGITETSNPAGELYSGERLRNVLAKSGTIGLQEVLGELMTTLKVYAGALDQADDITIMAIEYRGGAKEISKE